MMMIRRHQKQPLRVQQGINIGRRMKLSERVDPASLKCRNFPTSEEDSIDISDIIDDHRQPFDPHILSHFKPPQNPWQLRCNNYLPQNIIHSGKQPIIDQEVNQRKHKLVNFSIQINHLEEGEGQRASQIPKKEEEKQEFKNDYIYDSDEAGQVMNQEKHSSQNESQIRARKIKRAKFSRREIFSNQMLQGITRDFQIVKSKEPLSLTVIKNISQKYHLSHLIMLNMYKDWLEDPQLVKYRVKKEDSLGPLVDGLRARTHTRLKHITQMLHNNPYLTHKQISDRLYEKDKSKRRVLKSAIIRLLRIADFTKKKIFHLISAQEKATIRQKRIQYCQIYRSYEEKRANFYHLGEFIFHKYMFHQQFWTNDPALNSPQHSKTFIADAIVLVTFLTPSGNVYWEIRGGDYQNQEFTNLVTRMLKKMAKKKPELPTNVVLLGPSQLRKQESIGGLVQGAGGIMVRMPPKCLQLSPLEWLFQQLRQKARTLVLRPQQQFILAISQLVKTYDKLSMLNLIQTARQHTFANA